MPQYLVSGYLPDNFDPSTQDEAMMEEIHALNREMIAAGVRKFACGLGATRTLRPRPNGEVLITYGPYLETKERIGGNRACIAIARKLLKRSYHTLRELGGEALAPCAHRRIRMVVDLAAGHHRCPFVQQAAERADQPRLPLPPLAEQDDVVPGDQRPLEVRQYGLAEPDDAGERVLASAQPGQQVFSYLRPDPTVFVTAHAQLGNGLR